MTRLSGIRKDRTTTITDEEFNTMLTKAAERNPEYYALRDSSILCIFRLTGKRVRELSMLKRKDVHVNGNLSITFSLVKKRKKEALITRREKQISLSEPYAKPIVDYVQWLNNHMEKSIEWFYPRTHYTPSAKNQIHF